MFKGYRTPVCNTVHEFKKSSYAKNAHKQRNLTKVTAGYATLFFVTFRLTQVVPYTSYSWDNL